MARRTRVRLLLLLAVGLVIGLWLVTREAQSPPPAPVAGPAATAGDAPPTLIGTADANPRPEATEPMPPKWEAPARPWETRTGFDVGREGEMRASGRVVFEDGRPAADATVWKGSAYQPIFRTAAEKGRHDFFLAATKTDEEGRYRFSDRQIRSSLRACVLLARHGDRAALLLEPEDDGKHAEIPDLVLRPAILTRIDVVTGPGDPIAGALGRLRVHFGGMGIPAMLLGDLGDAEGRLTFLPLPDREDLLLELEVKHRQYPDVEADLDVDALRRGNVLRVEMPTGRTVRGRLVDAAGKPPKRVFLRVSGFDVEWNRQQLLEGVRGKPGDDGTFELHGVPAADSRLLVCHASKDLRAMLIGGFQAHVFEIAAGRHGEVLDLGVVYLEEPAAIRGTVSGPEGEPVVGA